MRALFADTRPLQHAHYRRLWTANIVTSIGAQLTVVAVPAQIYAITQSSAMVGLTGVFGLVPLVVFGLWGGALADSMDRRKLLLVTTTGLILTAALFWVQAALQLNNVWLLLAIFALQQSFFAVNQPVRTAILPKIIPMNLLPSAMSLNMTVVMAGAIVGPLVGGALIPIMGFAWLYLADTLFLLATLYAVIRLPSLVPDNAISSPGLRSVIDGFRYLRLHHVLLMSFVVDIIAMVFGMPRILFPEIAHESFGGPVDGGIVYALFFAAMPAGTVLGGIFSGWVSRVERQGLAVVNAIIVWGAAMAVLGLAVGLADRHLPAAEAAAGSTTSGPDGGLVVSGMLLVLLVVGLGMLVVGGAADMASAAFRSTMLQEAASDDVRGRLQGVFIVVVAGGPRLADILHGWAASGVGAGWATGGGGLLVIVGVVTACALVPAFHRYRVER
nr:MFS transporter [Brevibacterium yomogidense]